jgi:hypothetical protein
MARWGEPIPVGLPVVDQRVEERRLGLVHDRSDTRACGNQPVTRAA